MIRTRPANRSANPRHEGQIGSLIGARVEPDDVEPLAALLLDAVERGRHLVGRAQAEHRVADGDAIAQRAAQQAVDRHAVRSTEAVVDGQLDALADQARPAVHVALVGIEAHHPALDLVELPGIGPDQDLRVSADCSWARSNW